MGTMAVFLLFYWLFTLHLSSADVQFATHLSDTMDTPIFKIKPELPPSIPNRTQSLSE